MCTLSNGSLKTFCHSGCLIESSRPIKRSKHFIVIASTALAARPEVRLARCGRKVENAD